ncbi:hypothetical protein [Streptomyces sp. NPDC093589]|uniref:terpene synthase family protein n=1 Tax=Streptomyces sp. NPDC093589 TaxID=3366043 RepID=UPI003827D66D
MPQDRVIDIPLQSVINPSVEELRTRNLSWLRTHKLITSDHAEQVYNSWDVPQAMSRFFPRATVSDLAVPTDLMSVMAVLDDQFSGPASERIGLLTAATEELIAITHRPPGQEPALGLPVTQAWADAWGRACANMSDTWRQHTARNVKNFLASQIQEVRNQAAHSNAGRLPALEDFIMFRRETVAMRCFIDFIERCGHFELPRQVRDHPLLRTMNDAAVDATAWTNDVQSLDREAFHRDPNNIIFIFQQERGCSLEDAVNSVCIMITERIATYAKLRLQVNGLIQSLDLSPAEAADLRRYTEDMPLFISGNYAWGRTTARYRATPGAPAPYGDPLPVSLE